ncbi:MAG: VOC family protein [Thermoleophilia bacterium]|nr:VOC family protein [Thermoleophilia bacterium]
MTGIIVPAAAGSDCTAFALPRISQVGVVVRDVRRAAEYYSFMFGLGPFTIYDFTPDKQWYKEQPSHLTMRQGKTMWGDIELELMQPLEGESLFQDYLDEVGEGIQHLGFNVRSFDEAASAMRTAGFEPVMRAESYVETYQGIVKAAVFDTRRVGGMLFEVIWKSWLPECA